MARDSVFGEPVLWSGRPDGVTLPWTYRLVAGVSGTASVAALCFAVVIRTSLHGPVDGLLLFGAVCATIALFSWRLPIVWRAAVEYIVTERHVIWRRGRIRRTIERSSISYALIRWSPSRPGIGDLELVRAVRTGALRRTLALTFADVRAPDVLWALVRGVAPTATLGDGGRPLAQRLDAGERVLWTAIPRAARWTSRRIRMALLGVLLSALALVLVAKVVPTVYRVLRTRALSGFGSTVFVAGVSLPVVLLVGVAAAVAYFAWLRPRRLARHTRYLVTDRRVLIRRANEELCLDRSRIAYIIDAPSHGLHDVFLVLDGPYAPALASSGAFGEGDGDGLKPVLSAIDDAETVSEILKVANSSSRYQAAA